MKQNIHPTWHTDVQVTCACGHTFVTGSTLDKIEVDICAKCHPFFTGEMKFVDRQGRVDKFKKKMAAAQAVAEAQSTKKTKKQPAGSQAQKSYQEILREQRSSLRQAETPATQA